MIPFEAQLLRQFAIEADEQGKTRLLEDKVLMAWRDAETLIFITTEYLRFLNETRTGIVLCEMPVQNELMMHAISAQLALQNGLIFENGKAYLYNGQALFEIELQFVDANLCFSYHPVVGDVRETILVRADKSASTVADLLRTDEFYALRYNDELTLERPQCLATTDRSAANSITMEFESESKAKPQRKQRKGASKADAASTPITLPEVLEKPPPRMLDTLSLVSTLSPTLDAAQMQSEPVEEERKSGKHVAFNEKVTVFGVEETDLNGAIRSSSLFDEYDVLSELNAVYCSRLCAAFDCCVRELSCK